MLEMYFAYVKDNESYEGSIQGLTQVLDEIGGVFQADRQAHGSPGISEAARCSGV